MRSPSLSMDRGGLGLPRFTGLAVAVAAGLWLLLGPVPEALVFDRAAIGGGEVWRLVTGHLVHSDGRHALWDIGALALIGCLMENQRRLALVAGAGILAVDAGLWWGLPGLEQYCGLSGILNTLFIVALADLWRRHRHPVFPFAALALGIKLLAEAAAGQSLVLDTLWPAVPLAHVAGCLGGLAFLALEGGRFSNHPSKGEHP
jgi:rhomboid family GlyGly-CTERM serine protease